MKSITYFTLLFFVNSSLLIAQNKTYYTYIEPNSETYQLNIRPNNTFSITDRIDHSFDNISITTYLEGSLKREGSDLILDNRYAKKDYIFRVINEEKILNINFPFIAQDTLYLSYKDEYNTKNSSSFSGNWKNRKKDGLWRFSEMRNGHFSIEKEETYKDGKLIKVVYPNGEPIKTVTYKNVYNWSSLRRGYYKK